MSDNNLVSTATNFGPLKTNSFGERYLYQLNRGSFDKVSAYALYEKDIHQSLFNANTLTVIIGTDSGLLPQYIVQKGIPKGARYLFIEPKAILAELQAQGLLADLPSEICCVSIEQWEAQAKTFKIAEYFFINAVRSINSFAAQDANFEDYPELSWIVTEKLNQAYWSHSMSLGREGFITTQMSNLADNLLPASLLKDAFKGQTAIVLAGGPSLDESLPWVKANRDRLVVFAVSRIARQLQHAAIEPDFICSVDPNEFSFDVSKEMLHFSDKTTFIYAYHTVSKLVNQWPGKKLYLGSRLPWKSTLNVNNFEGAGPTVTNTAISTASAFGFKRIILAGVDLCFTRDGYTHAKGSDEALSGPRFNLTSLQIETNAGEMAPTSCDFLSAVNTLAMQASVFTQYGCKLINPSPNAAKIDHIEYLPLSDIALSDNLVKIIQYNSELLQKAQEKSSNVHELLLKELQQAQYQITAIKHLAEDAIQINNAMYNENGIIENYQDKRKLDKIEQKLKHQYRKFSNAVKNLGIREFIKITRPFDDPDITADEAKELCNIYYVAYRDGAKKFLELITDAVARIHSRMNESQPQPDINDLLQQWEKDKSYGRAKLLQDRINDAISDELKIRLQTYTEKFEQIIANKETGHLARAKSFSSLATFKNRAKLLFKHNKIGELKDLKAGLEKHPDQAEATDYQQLAMAYIADLEGEETSALAAYQAIIEGETESLYEDALLRITHLSLKREEYENCYLALQCLAQLSPIHLPMYAEVNRLRGDFTAASDIYAEYINQFPSDTLVQLKLASLYLDNNAFDAADVLLDYILKNAPDSKAALAFKSRTRLLIKNASTAAIEQDHAVNV